MIFEVTEKIDFTSNGVQKVVKTNFNLNIVVFEKTIEYRIYTIEKEKLDLVSNQENTFLMLLSKLEEQSYPIKIKTDSNGNFLEIYDFENWLIDFKIKIDSIIDQYEDAVNVEDIGEKFYDIVKNKDNFTKNKFKEPFWNVFFFNPPIDDKNKADRGTILEWNMKSIGIIPCAGRTKIVNPASKEIIVSFESNQKMEESILENIKEKTNKKGIKVEEVNVKLSTESYFDTIQKKITNKKASFKCSIKDLISYEEEITITLKQ